MALRRPVPRTLRGSHRTPGPLAFHGVLPPVAVASTRRLARLVHAAIVRPSELNTMGGWREEGMRSNAIGRRAEDGTASSSKCRGRGGRKAAGWREEEETYK